MLTDSSKIAKRIKTIRRHGKDKDFSMLGYNSRMYVLNAEIINPRLKFAERNPFQDKKIFRTYNEAFAGLSLQCKKCLNGLNLTTSKYVIRLLDKNTRKRVKDVLGASIHYETPLSANSMYESLHSRRDACTQFKTDDTVLFHSFMRGLLTMK